MEDSATKIKIVEPITPVKKTKTIKPITPTKTIVFVPIESVSASIIGPVESVCDPTIESVCDPTIESVSDESVEFVENRFPYNMISDSFYLLALNVFILKIGKETLNNKELKQGNIEPIKEETQPINLGIDDDTQNDTSGQYPNHL